ncbi:MULTISPECIES: type II 3-dehydroquinate dehydratase [unclassified Diaminobutyricimonas]|uniref:type II 3-dehydroquinate dehydratase n=1 Tax=unclassified Diaminobutyricimonas TaxID=2643261 RepID=UPI0012F50205|nr:MULTISPECIES: type II 3-dehydroquinate dehydratase [unclassified Diaminobutyricimonas]
MTTVLILNGPNLNLLGMREPHIYGSTTIGELEQLCSRTAAELGLEISFRQSNHEGELVDWIQAARTDFDGVIINPAGFTTTSVAILDALLAVEKPVVEVHISNIHRREEFRQHSRVSSAASAVIVGAGVQGYELALRHLAVLVNPAE